MSNNFTEFLNQEIQEAIKEFEEAKKEVINQIESISYYNAADFGAAYYSKIDTITKVGQKLYTLYDVKRVYQYFEKQAKENAE